MRTMQCAEKCCGPQGDQECCEEPEPDDDDGYVHKYKLFEKAIFQHLTKVGYRLLIESTEAI